MCYAVNQFDKLINYQNIAESEPKRKEGCVHLRVSNIIHNEFDLIS